MKQPPPRISMLAIRLAVWFFLLASLPILVLILFVRQNVHSAFLNLENRHHYDLAVMLARQVATSDNIEDARRSLSTLEGSGLNAFILSPDGNYLAHMDAGKINESAEADFSPAALRAILSQRDGHFAEPLNSQFFAFTPVAGQEAEVVVVARDSAIAAVMLQVEQDSYLQLLISMFIVLVGSGVVIWLLIGLPVRKLTRAAAQLSAGQLDVQVDSGDMIDDLAVLGATFNTMINRIRELVENLEERVKQRTIELTDVNEKLERQNKLFELTNQELAHEIVERSRAEVQLQRQLDYVRALARCSEMLLATSRSEADNRRLLVEASQQLIEPAGVSKIFLYENFNDPELGFCSRFIMDACAPGIPSAMEGANSAVIPWSIVPDENRRRLNAREPVGGPVRTLFAATPPFRDYLLNEVHVLSVQFYPIHFGECWWGYVGFDDRVNEREWREEEILLLGAAAEILSSTLQRWQAEDNLRAINERLEQQVKARTSDLSDTVALLQQEIKVREEAEAELQQVLASLERRVAARTRELSTFFDLTVLAGRAANLADVFQQAVPRMLEVTHSRAICLHLFATDRTTLALAAQQNLPGDDQPQLQQVELPPKFQRWLQRLNDPLVTTNLATLDILPPAFRLPEFQSYLGAQIRIGRQIEGVLSCYRFSGRGFGLDEISLVVALAEQMGILVETHRLRQTAAEMAVIEERQRLARDLHDSVTQSIYSLTLFARSGRQAAEDSDQTRLTASLAELEANSLHALREMRLLLYELLPLELEKEGLVRALDLRFNTVEHRAGLAVNFQAAPDLRLPSAVELELYHLTIEALNNILKHAQASEVMVSLAADDSRVRLVVADNGCGFDPQQAPAGLGLKNMHDRVEQLGGGLTIVSAPGAGTQIMVEIDRPEAAE